MVFSGLVFLRGCQHFCGLVKSAAEVGHGSVDDPGEDPGGGSLIRTAYKEMRGAYTAWCRLEGVAPISAHSFTKDLKLRWGIDTIRSNGTRFYTNVTLLNDADEPENDLSAGMWSDLGGGTF